MNMVIFLPPGGPKFLPPRLSSSTSMEFWHMKGVVALEKLILSLKVIIVGAFPSIGGWFARGGPMSATIRLPNDTTLCSTLLGEAAATNQRLFGNYLDTIWND